MSEHLVLRAVGDRSVAMWLSPELVQSEDVDLTAMPDDEFDRLRLPPWLTIARMDGLGATCNGNRLKVPENAG